MASKNDHDEVPFLGAERDTAADEVPSLADGVPSMAEPKGMKSPADVDWLGAIADEFSGKRDKGGSAKAMFKTMGYAGGLTADALAELVTRLKSFGKNGIGLDEWKKAAKGEATPLSEQLEKNGYGSVSSKLIGLPAQVIADPMNAMFSGASAAKPAAQSLWSALKMNAMQPLAPLQPIGAGLRKAGRTVFGLPFRPVNADIATKYRSSLARPDYQEISFAPSTAISENLPGAGNKTEVIPGQLRHQDKDTQFTDWLFNDGNPRTGGFNKSNAEIGEDITKLKQEAGSKLGEIRGTEGLPDIDLAPDLESNTRKMMEIEAMAGGKKFKGTPYDWLGKKIRGSKAERDMAALILKESAPRLAELVDRNLENLTFSQREAQGYGFFDSLLKDLSEGPRSVSNASKMSTSYRQSAAGSEPFGGNQYMKNARYNEAKVVDKATGEAMADAVDDVLMENIPNAPEYQQTKRDYGIAARGEVPAQKAVKKAISKPPLSKFDLAALGAAFMNPGAAMKILIPWMGAKAGQVMSVSPRVSTGTGMMLNKLGESGIWDAMMRRSIIDSNKRD